MKVNATCPICNTLIVTNRTNRDVDLSDHIEDKHPIEYDKAAEINLKIIALLAELHTLTNCYTRQMFIITGKTK